MEKYLLLEVGIFDEMVLCDNLCEMYNEIINEQQFFEGLSIDLIFFLYLVVVNDEVFFLSCELVWFYEYLVEILEMLRVECYNLGSD